MRYLSLAILCVSVCLLCGGCKEKSPPEDGGEATAEIETFGEAPTFVAEDLDGNTIDLTEEAKNVDYVLLDFWASWCGPCRHEFPYLRSIQEEHKDHRLLIIGVSLDYTKSAAVNSAEMNRLDYPHILNGSGEGNDIASLYGVRSIPATFLLDSDLNIVAKGLRGEELEEKLSELLGPGAE